MRYPRFLVEKTEMNSNTETVVAAQLETVGFFAVNDTKYEKYVRRDFPLTGKSNPLYNVSKWGRIGTEWIF